MSRTLRSLSMMAFALFAACSVSIPEGRFKCDTNDDCPSRWVCVESLCRSDGSSGGGDGGAQHGGNDGGSQQDGGDDFDAGIDTTGCDAFTTFYRDSDEDGLGAATESVAACSVASGYVTNADDCNDVCTACTTPDATEICDGFDNECDGKVDDGALEFSTRVSFDAIRNSQWVEVVGTDDGGVTFALSLVDQTLGLVAQRFDASGAVIGAALPIPGAEIEDINLIAAEHLNGKIVLAWFESGGISATVLKASDLTVLVKETTLVAAAQDASSLPVLDIVVSSSASGGRVLLAYQEGSAVKVQAFRLSDLILDISAKTVYTPANPASFVGGVTLTAAPCLSGFYAAVLDMGNKVLRVFPLGNDGSISGQVYSATLPDGMFFTAHPALRVEGGDCNNPPTRLIFAYVVDEALVPAAPAEGAPPLSVDLHVEYLSISRTNDLDVLSLAGELTLKHEGVVPVAFYPFPFPIAYRALDLVPYAGRYVLALSSATTADADRGRLSVFEIDETTLVATKVASAIEPAIPKTLQLAVVGGVAWAGTSGWTNMDPAGLMRIGCGSP